MKRIFEILKKRAGECEADGRMFSLPSIEDTSLSVAHEDIEPTGSVITGDEWHLTKGQEWLDILYESKDKSRTFQDNPDRSYITIKGQVLEDNTLADVNYSNGWDESSSRRF